MVMGNGGVTATVTLTAVLMFCGVAPNQGEMQRALVMYRNHRDRMREIMRARRKRERLGEAA